MENFNTIQSSKSVGLFTRIGQANQRSISISSEEQIMQVNEFIGNANVYASITDITIEDNFLIIYFSNGLVFNCGYVRGEKVILRKTTNGIEYKYETDGDDEYQLLVELKELALDLGVVREEDFVKTKNQVDEIENTLVSMQEQIDKNEIIMSESEYETLPESEKDPEATYFLYED